jgi:hypothetical protein
MMLPVKTITEHAHNLYRMSSNLRSIAYDLHYCRGSKNYRRQNKMTFFPENSQRNYIGIIYETKVYTVICQQYQQNEQ